MGIDYSVADYVEPRLGQVWRESRDHFDTFLRDIELPNERGTRALSIWPQEVADPAEYLRRWPDIKWAYLTATGPDGPVSMMFPADADEPADLFASQFVDVHSRLVSWWLVNAWRASELVAATWNHGEKYENLAAAACARSLLETASSFWVDSRKLQALWAKVKEDTKGGLPDYQQYRSLSLWIWQTMWGSKFDDRAPHLKEHWGKFQRTNVLSHIDKLAKASSPQLQDDYAWLCNAVHPSVGGTLLYSSPLLAHESKTHAFSWLGPFPMRAASPTEKSSEETVQRALVRASSLAVVVLERVLDDSLRVVDDIGLTTGAPRLANFEYWRNLAAGDRNQPCPCRSGRKNKRCSHSWTDPSPSIQSDFHEGGSPVYGSTR